VYQVVHPFLVAVSFALAGASKRMAGIFGIGSFGIMR
jgi:hypothetical protein